MTLYPSTITPDAQLRLRRDHAAGQHPRTEPGCPVCRHADRVEQSRSAAQARLEGTA